MFFFHQLGPLGRVGLGVAKSVCVFVCLSPSHGIFFAWSDWCGACLVRGLVRVDLDLDLDLNLDL